MNAISSLPFVVQNQSTDICLQHQGGKIQIGPHSQCPQCAVEYLANQQQRAQAEVDHMVREKHFAAAMLPKRHANSGFKNYKVQHSGQQAAVNQVISFAKSIVQGDQNNLVMVGPTGTGKTHLSCATARTLLNKGKHARYITSEALAQRIMDAWNKPDATEKSVIYAFSQYDLLILDEYGLHDRDKRRELVHKVLYARYDRMQPTMLISNFTLEELKHDLGDRLWSRFQQGNLSMVQCHWSDQRLSAVFVP